MDSNDEPTLSDLENKAKALNEGSQVILLRHGNSMSNQEHDALLSSDYTDDQLKTLKKKVDLIDCHLSELGYRQCQEAQPLANLLNVKHVIVSPLLRALETAHNVFKEHPNFKNITFTVLPLMKECIVNSDDVPGDIVQRMDEYREIFPNFDTSELEKYEDMHNFFLYDVDMDWARDLLQTIASRNSKKETSGFRSEIMELLTLRFPLFLESDLSLYKRVLKSKEFLKQFLIQNPLEGDEKIVLVGHRNVFNFWTNKWDKDSLEDQLDQDECIKPPEDAYYLKNCEFYPYDGGFP
ncbi:unnamed protein product [Moneuplotes crassus]|uniref:Uncharacterized protein n=1 Tax=Euplotes crassus TaxID=5936 RepID=A0AAD1XQG5_EUPCR|nr:unnamed protein product [Moneuplotes crassus]